MPDSRHPVRLCPADARQQIDWSPGRVPLWQHWGAPHGGPALALSSPLPPATLQHDPQLDLCPVEGSGWMQHPALAGLRPGSRAAWAPVWEHAAVSVSESQADVVLEDRISGLRWRQRWRHLDGADTWMVETELHNAGDSDYQLEWLAAVTLPLPQRVCRALVFGGLWAGEFQQQEVDLPPGLWRRDNRRGRTSHDHFPGLIAATPACGEDAGEAWGVHLAFSGNHSLLVETLTDGRRQLQMGELLQGGEQLLAPGATYTAPRAYLSYSEAGYAGISAAFHSTLRRHILPPAVATPRPVHLNTWEAMYFQHDQARIGELARLAAAVGVERFVLDDGWFHGRDHDRAGLGDWWPAAEKYPQGLQPLADLVTGLGMQFGLWVEPEMVNPDSALFRSHPDWVLSEPGREQVLGRNQLVLDLTRADVQDYLFASLDRLLAELPIRYLKWDMNRDLAPASGNGRVVAGAQVRAFYALLQRVRGAHPDVEIESCASGGGRADFAVLALTERIWTSDCNDPLERIAIQRGFQRFFPPEIMGAHIGPAPAHTTGRHHRLDFRAAVALCGHFGIEADLAAISPTEREQLARWIGLHKRLRGVVHGATVHQGTAADGIAYSAYWNDQQQAAVLCVFRVHAAVQRYPAPLILPWLRDKGTVLIRACTPNDTALPEGWDQLHSGMSADGAQLAVSGLPLPPMVPESAWILELHTQR